MSTRLRIIVAAAILALVLSSAYRKAPVQGAEGLRVAVTQNTRAVPLYEVFELAFQHENAYADPFFDVTLDVRFTSPSGKAVNVGGFHYGSAAGPKIEVRTVKTERGDRREVEYRFDRQDLWKARFAPAEPGAWRYTYVFANASGAKATGAGAFACVKGRAPSPGFLRQHPTNPFAWVFDDSSAYFPIGLQECVGDGPGVGTGLSAMAMEGPFRMDRQGRPEPPPGATFRPGPSSNPVNGDVYFRHYARAGFNLFRFSQRNCSWDLYRDLDHYHVQQAVMTDELLRHARKYGFRVFYGLFGYQPVFNEHPENAENMEKVKRFVKYSVDRWGAYVDVWEFLNEQKAAAGWYDAMIPYLHALDPYHHPITTSWERPELPGIEVNAPHWYSREDERQSDAITAGRAREWKKHGKPVVVGEQGNTSNRNQPQPGVGGVWDARSALRMRLRNWSALFNQISFIFWATSYAKDGHFMNIWLGPKEREYVRAMQDFAYRLDKDVAPMEVATNTQGVRAYGLASRERAGVYLHHFADHEAPLTGAAVTLDVPKATAACWYSPENGAVLGRFRAAAGRQTFTAPAFTVDLALLLSPEGPPDSDRDGQANDVDPDDDNDGVADTKDAFPLEPEEWEDKDGDLIGDYLDADVDADGVGDDLNKNGTPDHEEMDLDGDGVPRANAVPWDAFPRDPKEWRDTDGDGIGDNADPDDDGDGWPDADERRAKKDPLDRLSFPTK